MKNQELVINWHITEACNFKCQYCFAHWEKACKKELFRDEVSMKILLSQIAYLPEILLTTKNVAFSSIRLNLVGGETFLYPSFVKQIVHYATQLGFKLSAITNGSPLNDELIEFIATHFDSLGFSMDSIVESTNLLIGRQQKGKAIQADEILQKITKLRQFNPKLHLKINTVVNHLNYHEDLNSFIALANPNKWKIFKMLPITTDRLAINYEQFEHFLFTHRAFSSIISAENNEEMINSYLMIDPLGRFFANNNEMHIGYHYSAPILSVGIAQALQQIEFDPIKFQQRYQ